MDPEVDHVGWKAGDFEIPLRNNQRQHHWSRIRHPITQGVAKDGITVNAIASALIETEMVTGNPNARPDLIPVGRFGTVDEVADVAVMLARNGYVTGQAINVNGGWFMS